MSEFEKRAREYSLCLGDLIKKEELLKIELERIYGVEVSDIMVEVSEGVTISEAKALAKSRPSYIVCARQWAEAYAARRQAEKVVDLAIALARCSR